MTPDYRTWSNTLGSPAERLSAFESWLAGQLATRLTWPRDPHAKQRVLGQCRACVMTAVADLGKHGYLFRGRELAAYLTAQIDAIAQHQQKGGVRELYAYFRKSWDNWVGRQAEELQAAAKHARVYAQAATEIQHAKSIPELALIAERARQEARKLTAGARAVRKARKTLADVPPLPGFSGR